MTYIDPLDGATGSDALGAAVGWVQATLLGTIAAAVAVIAIAAIGLGMLWGRIDLKRGAGVIFGCFIIFGASGIASGILNAARLADDGSRDHVYLPPPPPAPSPVITAPPAYDPYAGASVPRN